LTDGAVEGIDIENVIIKDHNVKDGNEGGEACGFDGGEWSAGYASEPVFATAIVTII
jgi:hypothetical protein